jgi:hypothetical protein
VCGALWEHLYSDVVARVTRSQPFTQCCVSIVQPSDNASSISEEICVTGLSEDFSVREPCGGDVGTSWAVTSSLLLLLLLLVRTLCVPKFGSTLLQVPASVTWRATGQSPQRPTLVNARLSMKGEARARAASHSVGSLPTSCSQRTTRRPSSRPVSCCGAATRQLLLCSAFQCAT